MSGKTILLVEDNPGGVDVTKRALAKAHIANGLAVLADGQEAEKDLCQRECSFVLVLDAIPDAVLFIDSQGALRFINRAAETLTAWTRKKALGRHITEIVTVVDEPHSGGVGRFRDWSEGAARQNGLAEAEFRIAARSGVLHWVRARIAAMNGLDGRPLRAVILEEITKQKETLLILRRQADLLEQVHEPILTRRLRGPITFWNHAAEQLYGFSRDEVMGRLAPQVLKTVYSQSAGEIESTLERDGRWRGELLQSTKTGRQIVVESLMVTVNEPSGVTTVLETHRDVTDRKRVEKEVRQLNAELEQRVRERTAQMDAVNKELEAFAYSVSHDLRAPLRGIDGWSLALQEDYGSQLDEMGCGYLSRVRAETQRMGLLIDDLLQLSRVTRAEMYSERADLSSIAAGIAIRLREAQPARPLEFLIAPDLTALGDARLLEIALTNLLGNAAKFTLPCSPARIEFGQSENNGRPIFYVRDNGVGFDMAYAATLFGAFQRLHKASEFPGTGIGLATVQRIIVRHGGRVWAESKPGHGATFYFTIRELGDTPSGERERP